MSINMILGSAQSQTNSIKSLTTSQIGSYQQIQQALSNFMFQTNSLQGAAYDSAKAYCGSVLSPLIDGCILLNKAIEKANEEYINKYTSEVYGDSLKQSDLERLIDETKSQIALNENLLNEQFEQDPVDLSEVSNLQEKIDSYRKIQRDLEEKLSKLLAFDANSVSIFQEVDVLSYSVAQGIALAQRSWSPTLKTFMLPGKNEMGWVGTIKEIWEKNNKESNKTNSIKSSKRMINSQINAEEYDRYVAHYSGLHGKPIIGASVIHNASSEEKRDLLITVLPWTIPGGGSLKTIMASSSFIAGLESIIKGNKPSEILTNMALGGLAGYGFYKVASKVNIREQLKNFRKPRDTFRNYEVKWLAYKATHNPKANTVTLGKYEKINRELSYDTVAKKHKDTYFDMGEKGWNEASAMVNGNKDEMWRVNKQFLDTQIAKGKTFRFSHDPKIEDGSYYNREIDYLNEHGYIIDEENKGGLWYARPGTD